MSDAFSDLWKTAHPTQSTSKPSALKDVRAQPAASPPPWARQAAKTDAFSILASASPKPSLGSVTPQRQTASSQKPASRGGDAFSDLVSIGAQSNSSKLSLAAAAQQSRPASSLAQSKQTTQPASSAALWDQLDMLGSSSTPPTASVSRMSTGASHSSATNDLWDMDLLGGAPAPSQDMPSITQSPPTPQRATAASSSSSSSNVFDLLGDFGGPPPARSSPSPRLSPDPPASLNATRSSTPASFDFGDREDSNAGAGNASDDDILGMLGQPVKAVRQQVSPAAEERRPSRPTSRASPVASGRSSPPPHIIGQIVEMGFTPDQARVALASTSTGVDVQAALETLLQNGAAGNEGAIDAAFDARNSSDEENERRERERRKRHAERRQRPAAEQREPAEALGAADSLQVQADKLLNQASEIGMSMFSKANAFWNQGKERVQKAYEERSAAAAPPRPSTSSSPAPGKARPRWMATEGEGDLASPVGDGGSAFRDGSDDDEAAPPPRRAPKQPPAPSPRAPPAPVQSNGTGSSARKFLFDDSQPSGGYVSAFRGSRRGQQSSNASPQPTRGSSPVRALAPAAPPPPTFATAPSSVLTAAAAHKAKANESFKLGAYPAAITSYSAALGALPEGHMARVALLNNRALASIRIGEWKNAIEDCSTAISLIRPTNAFGSPYLGTVPAAGTQAAGTNLPRETIHLGDALLKALSRRAAAHEMGEKWPSALADWDAVLQAALLPMAAGGGDIGKSRGEALRGSERCKKMVGIVADPASAPAPAPVRPARRPVPKPVTANAPPSEAVQRVRAANAAANAEDQQKSVLKDGVDAKLQAWKGGKENNIRALIASLDSVLWPELGWQTVGMAELISPKQLKVRYMKAIAKLHPDKLNVVNTTVEQRMIANGVFATLNEAWDASNI